MGACPLRCRTLQPSSSTFRYANPEVSPEPFHRIFRADHSWRSIQPAQCICPRKIIRCATRCAFCWGRHGVCFLQHDQKEESDRESDSHWTEVAQLLLHRQVDLASCSGEDQQALVRGLKTACKENSIEDFLGTGQYHRAQVMFLGRASFLAAPHAGLSGRLS